MAGTLAINMSDSSFPVYGSYSDFSTKIGTIYKREAFVWNVFDAIVIIYFRNSSGNFTQGYISDAMKKELAAAGAFTNCTAYPYSTAKIGGTTYYTFKFNRREPVITVKGTSWGAVAEGMQVACRNPYAGTSGNEYINYKQVAYVERSSDHEWVPVTGDGLSYGLVKIGFDSGSEPSTISMYGSW